MKVLGIGESVIDQMTFIRNGEPLPGRSEKHVGGPVLAGMILLTRLGIDCTYISTLGRDENGEMIKTLLKHESVRLLPKYQHQTKVNTIYVQQNTGVRKKCRGKILHKPLHGIDKKMLQQFDMVIFDRHETTAFYEVVSKKAAHTKILIDPSIEVSKFTMDMIRYADYPVIPIEFVSKTDSDFKTGLHKVFALCQRPVIVTAGDLGSLIFDGKTINVIPAKEVNAVDTTGAGDIYRGGFAYGVLQGWNISASAIFGNLVAGLQCTKIGNAAAIPTNAEILLHACKTQTKKHVTLPRMDAYFQQLL